MTNKEFAMKVKAVPALWEQVRRLCFLILRCFAVGHEENLAAHGVTMEDLEQEAFLAVLDAVEAYTPGLAFVSYLAYPIRNRAGALCGLRTRREKPLGHEEPIGGRGDLSLPLKPRNTANAPKGCRVSTLMVCRLKDMEGVMAVKHFKRSRKLYLDYLPIWSVLPVSSVSA